MTSAAVPLSAISDQNEHMRADRYFGIKNQSIFFATTSTIVSWSACKFMGVPTFEDAFSSFVSLIDSGNTEIPTANMVSPMVALAVTGASLGAVNTVVNWFHESFERLTGLSFKKVWEWIRDKTGIKPEEKVPVNIWNRYTNELAILVTGKDAATAVEKTLSAMDAEMKSEECGKLNVIVCHRYNLQAAMQAVSDFAASRNEMTSVNLFHDGNVGPIEVAPPAILKMKNNGDAVAIWADNRGKPNISVRYDKDGHIKDVYDISGNQVCQIDDLQNVPSLAETLGRMERSLDRRIQRIISGSKEMIFDSTTHNVIPEADGSFLVVDKNTNKVDNPYGPAVITANGDRMYFRDGKSVSSPWKYVDSDEQSLKMKNANEALYIEKSLTT